MKKIFCFIAFSAFLTLAGFSQQTATPGTPMTKQDYLKKSRSQKTFAWILLGTGTACFAAVAPGNTSFDALGTIIVIGGVAVISSIPLFIAAAKNKRRAGRASVGLNLQRTVSLPGMGVQNLPGLSVKWKL